MAIGCAGSVLKHLVVQRMSRACCGIAIATSSDLSSSARTGKRDAPHILAARENGVRSISVQKGNTAVEDLMPERRQFRLKMLQ
jgi:hypothetical protein